MKIRVALFGLAACATLCAMPPIAGAKIFPMIFETNLGGSRILGDEPLAAGSGTIGEFKISGTTAVPVNPALITGLHGPDEVALFGDDLFILNHANGTVGKYTTSGSAVAPALIKGLRGPTGIAVFGDDLFILNHAKGTVDHYNASSGATLKLGLITGLHGPVDLEEFGGNLFILNRNTGTIGEYNATTGQVINAALVSGLHVSGPRRLAFFRGNFFVANDGAIFEFTTSGLLVNMITGVHGVTDIAVFGNNLFVVNHASGTIGEYNAITGKAINPSLITGLRGPNGIAIMPGSASVPDASSTWILLLLGMAAVFALRLTVRQPA